MPVRAPRTSRARRPSSSSGCHSHESAPTAGGILRGLIAGEVLARLKAGIAGGENRTSVFVAVPSAEVVHIYASDTAVPREELHSLETVLRHIDEVVSDHDQYTQDEPRPSASTAN